MSTTCFHTGVHLRIRWPYLNWHGSHYLFSCQNKKWRTITKFSYAAEWRKPSAWSKRNSKTNMRLQHSVRLWPRIEYIMLPKKVMSVKWQQMSVNITQHAFSRQNFSAKCWEKYNIRCVITRQILCWVIPILFSGLRWASPQAEVHRLAFTKSKSTF